MEAGPTIELIEYASPLYKQARAFREEHLRVKLGLTQTAEDVAGEDTQLHIAALASGEVVGTVVLKPASPALIKLRQMAVAPQLRGTGVGERIVRFAERLASDRGFTEIEMAARVSVRGFYEKLGYEAIGEPWIELTIPHIKMAKRLG